MTRPDLLAKPGDPNHRDDPGQPAYWVQVTEQAPLSCGIVSVLPDGRTEVIHLTVHPDGSGARIVERSTSNVMTLWEAFCFYLTDVATDYMIATLDAARGRAPSRAIWLRPFDAPTLWLQRKLPVKGEPLF